MSYFCIGNALKQRRHHSEFLAQMHSLTQSVCIQVPVPRQAGSCCPGQFTLHGLVTRSVDASAVLCLLREADRTDKIMAGYRDVR
jgi:hypothetical protein